MVWKEEKSWISHPLYGAASTMWADSAILAAILQAIKDILRNIVSLTWKSWNSDGTLELWEGRNVQLKSFCYPYPLLTSTAPPLLLHSKSKQIIVIAAKKRAKTLTEIALKSSSSYFWVKPLPAIFAVKGNLFLFSSSASSSSFHLLKLQITSYQLFSNLQPFLSSYHINGWWVASFNSFQKVQLPRLCKFWNRSEFALTTEDTNPLPFSSSPIAVASCLSAIVNAIGSAIMAVVWVALNWTTSSFYSTISVSSTYKTPLPSLLLFHSDCTVMPSDQSSALCECISCWSYVNFCSTDTLFHISSPSIFLASTESPHVWPQPSLA